MKYLTKTSELLFDPAFFRLASMWNAGFTMLDPALFDRMSTTENPFQVDAKNWYALCSNTKTLRIYGGYAVPFVAYVGKNIQSTITAEWVAFEATTKEQKEKEREKAIREFFDEVKQVRTTIPNKAYLEPVQKFMYETLDTIEGHYKQLPLTTNVDIAMAEQSQRTKLKWRGGASALCALFLDLRAEKMKKAESKYLSIGDADLTQFIIDNFEFVDSENEPEAIADETIKRYIEKKPIAKRIKLDFTDLTK